jgi:glycosyltransferase involved in cell wall biosynthesis
MKVSIAINNYNYSRYITECVDSVLSQTYQNFEIIVVDDGSTDNSVDIIKQKYSNEERIKIVLQKNAGQLSTFNKALDYISGDIVCFLDADDTYNPKYLENIVKYYKENNICDFLFCDRNYIDDKGNIIEVDKKKHILSEKECYGYTPAITFLNKLWIGSSTSCISMKIALFRDILPIPFERDWITRADDCLVWGASLKMGYKCYLNDPLVNYRVHGSNYYYGRKNSNEQLYIRDLRVERLFSFFSTDLGYAHIYEKLALEFKALPDKTKKDVVIYLRILFNSDASFIRKTKQALSILRSYIKDGK